MPPHLRSQLSAIALVVAGGHVLRGRGVAPGGLEEKMRARHRRVWGSCGVAVYSVLPARYGSSSFSSGLSWSRSTHAARSNSLCSTPLVCRSTVRPRSCVSSNGS